MKTIVSLSIIAVLVGVCGAALAQPEGPAREGPRPGIQGQPGPMGGVGMMGPRMGSGQGRGGGPPFQPGRAKELVQTLMIARLTEELALNDEQSVLLVRRLKAFQEKGGELKKARQELLESLKKSIRAGEDDGKIEQNLVAVMDNDAQALEQKKAMFDEISEGLTVTQRAKLYIALSDFETEMRQMIQRAREQAGGRRARWGQGPGGPGPGAGPGPGQPAPFGGGQFGGRGGQGPGGGMGMGMGMGMQQRRGWGGGGQWPGPEAPPTPPEPQPAE